MKRKFYQLQSKSFDDQKVENLKQLWETLEKQGYEGIALTFKTVLTKDSENKFHAVFSTDSEDRHHDVVVQNWELKFYKKNPVYLDSHNYDSIEHILGRVSGITTKDGALEGDIEFALDNPKGMLAMKLADKGFLNASSVGFIPKEFDDKGRILKSELLEISAVSVPANPEALFEKSVETEVEKKEEVKDPEPQEPVEEKQEEKKEEEKPEEVEMEPKKVDVNRTIAKVFNKWEVKRAEKLKIALQVIDSLGEDSKVETRTKSDRANTKRMINQAIRKLIKEKEKC